MAYRPIGVQIHTEYRSHTAMPTIVDPSTVLTTTSRKSVEKGVVQGHEKFQEVAIVLVTGQDAQYGHS
jgi:hypothetical protein